jgi:hypothetical protein
MNGGSGIDRSVLKRASVQIRTKGTFVAPDQPSPRATVLGGVTSTG